MENSNKKIRKIKIINFFKKDNKIMKDNTFISRLIPKNIFYEGMVHEQIDSNLPRIILDIEVEHDGYMYINKSDRNIKLILEELKLNPYDCYMLYQAAKTYYTNKEYYLASNYFNKFYKKTNVKTDNFYTDGILLYLYNCIQTKEFEKGLKVIDDNF